MMTQGCLEALATAQETAVLEHGGTVGVQRPVAALARAIGSARDLDETVIETEVVTERVLPALNVLSVVGEAVHDEGVDLTQGHHLIR